MLRGLGRAPHAMKSALAILAALLCAAASPTGARAAACGLPDTKPVWIEYAEGSVQFRNEVFGHPGIVVGSSGITGPAALRADGAQTVYWEMHLGLIAGTTLAPADAATIPDKAQRLFDRAVASSGCATPYIALNELNGASTTTPWTISNAGYRANVLALM